MRSKSMNVDCIVLNYYVLNKKIKKPRINKTPSNNNIKQTSILILWLIFVNCYFKYLKIIIYLVNYWIKEIII